jgi:hypothetical protein
VGDKFSHSELEFAHPWLVCIETPALPDSSFSEYVAPAAAIEALVKAFEKRLLERSRAV